MEIITHEFLPYLGRIVWIRYDTTIDVQRIEGLPRRRMVWGRYSWGDTNIGPWEPFRWIAFGVRNA